MIETTAEETWGQDIVKRTIKLTNTEKVNCVLILYSLILLYIMIIVQKDHRTVTQLHYVEWSQQLCPSTSSPILNLIDVLESIQRKTNNGPITIHCRLPSMIRTCICMSHSLLYIVMVWVALEHSVH